MNSAVNRYKHACYKVLLHSRLTAAPPPLRTFENIVSTTVEDITGNMEPRLTLVAIDRSSSDYTLHPVSMKINVP